MKGAEPIVARPERLEAIERGKAMRTVAELSGIECAVLTLPEFKAGLVGSV